MHTRRIVGLAFSVVSAVFLPACGSTTEREHDIAKARVRELEALEQVAAREETFYVPAKNALGPYSSAVVVGDLALLSGKIGERGQSFEHEVETCLDAVLETLTELGLTFADVVEARVYLTDMARYAEFNEIYGRRMSAPYPARTCVAVAGLPGGAQVEVQVAARR